MSSSGAWSATEFPTLSGYARVAARAVVTRSVRRRPRRAARRRPVLPRPLAARGLCVRATPGAAPPRSAHWFFEFRCLTRPAASVALCLLSNSLARRPWPGPDIQVSLFCRPVTPRHRAGSALRSPAVRLLVVPTTTLSALTPSHTHTKTTTCLSRRQVLPLLPTGSFRSYPTRVVDPES